MPIVRGLPPDFTIGLSGLIDVSSSQLAGRARQGVRPELCPRQIRRQRVAWLALQVARDTGLSPDGPDLVRRSLFQPLMMVAECAPGP